MADGFQNFLLGYNAGHALKAEREKQNALDTASKAAGSGDFKGGANALLRVGDYQGYGALNQQADRQDVAGYGKAFATDPQGAIQGAMSGGRIDVASQLQGMDGEARKRATESLAGLANLAGPLRGVPDPMQRLQMLQQSLQGTPWATPQAEQKLQEMGQQGGLTDERLTQLLAFGGPDAFKQTDRDLGGQVQVRDPWNNPVQTMQKTAAPAPAGSGERYRPATAQEIADFGLPDGAAAQIDDRTGKINVLNRTRQYTEFSGKAAEFAHRMAGATPTMAKLESDADFSAEAVWHPMGAIFSQSAKNYRIAAKEWIAALLRKDTGAAVTPQEFDFYGNMYLPVPGDGAEQLAAKRAARKRAEDGLRAASQGASEEWFPEDSGAPEGAPPPAAPASTLAPSASALSDQQLRDLLRQRGLQ